MSGFIVGVLVEVDRERSDWPRYWPAWAATVEQSMPPERNMARRSPCGGRTASESRVPSFPMMQASGTSPDRAPRRPRETNRCYGRSCSSRRSEQSSGRELLNPPVCSLASGLAVTQERPRAHHGDLTLPPGNGCERLRPAIPHIRAFPGGLT